MLTKREISVLKRHWLAGKLLTTEAAWAIGDDKKPKKL